MRPEKDFYINRKKLKKLEHKGSGWIGAAQWPSCGFTGPISANLAYVVMRQGGLCDES